jgi:teichuronic acid exporter
VLRLSVPEYARTEGTSSAAVLTRGILWIGTFRWTAQVLSWVSTLVVIRFLSPADYGIIGMALTWIGLATVISELGLGSAIIALPKLSDDEAAQLHAVAISAGGVVALVSLAATPLIATFYREPLLTAVVPVLSILFVLESIRTVPVALLARGLQYRSVAVIDFSRSVGSTVCVLVLAVLGWGYWALVAGTLAGTAVASAWALHIKHPGLAMPRWRDLRLALEYSRDLVVNRIAWQLYVNADYVLVGRLLGVQPLGYYAVARNLAALPGEKLGNVVTAATAPFFASIQSDATALRHYFLRVTSVMCMVLHPLLIGFLLVADLAVPLVLGSHWSPAVPALRILVLYAAVHAVTTLLQQVLVVTGNTRTVMWSALIALVIMVPAFLLGIRLRGIEGAALTWVAAFPLVIALPLRAALRATGVSISRYLQAWLPALEGVAAMAAAVVFARWFAGNLLAPIAVALELVLAIAAGALAYLILARLRHPAVFRWAFALRRSSIDGLPTLDSAADGPAHPPPAPAGETAVPAEFAGGSALLRDRRRGQS